MTVEAPPIARAKALAREFVAAVYPGRELFCDDTGAFHMRSVGTHDAWWLPMRAAELRPVVRHYLRRRGLLADARAVRDVVRGMRWTLPPLADANSYQTSRNLAGIESNEQHH
jgi:hypothetical protein